MGVRKKQEAYPFASKRRAGLFDCNGSSLSGVFRKGG